MKRIIILFLLTAMACKSPQVSILKDGFGEQSGVEFGISFDTNGNYESNTVGETIVDFNDTFGEGRGRGEVNEVRGIGDLVDNVVEFFSDFSADSGEDIRDDDPLILEGKKIASDGSDGASAPKPSRSEETERRREVYRNYIEAKAAVESQQQTGQMRTQTADAELKQAVRNLVNTIHSAGTHHNSQVENVVATIADLEAIAAQLKDDFKSSPGTEIGKKIRLKAAYIEVASRTAVSRDQKELLRVAKSALAVADEAAASGNVAEAELAMEMATAMTDLAIGLTPGVGWVNDVYEAVTGKDRHGNTLTTIERAFAILGVATAGYGSKVLKLGKALKVVGKIAIKYGSNAAQAIRQSQWIADTTSKIGVEGADALHGFVKWLKKPLHRNPQRGAIGSATDATLEIIKGLRPEKAIFEGSKLFSEVPKSLRSNVWDVMENLPQSLKGDHAATEFIQTLRPHPMTANLRGWTSLDLVQNNPSASSLRFLYKEQSDGSIKWMIKDTH